MPGSPPLGTDHTSPSLTDRPTRAAQGASRTGFCGLGCDRERRPVLVAVRWVMGSERPFPICIGCWSSLAGFSAISISM